MPIPPLPRRRTLLLTLALLAAPLAAPPAPPLGMNPANRAFAGDRCCALCGKPAHCVSTCRLVPEEKKVTITCWGTKCEEFCVPGPSRPGCRHVDWVCDEPSDTVCAAPRKFSWTQWLPSCNAQTYTRTRLMKKTVTKKIPSYKWVVEDLCERCQGAVEIAELPSDAAIPLPPIIDATTTR